MTFKERFYDKIVNHSKIFGTNFPKILSEQKTIDNAISTLGENTVISLSGLIGLELGNETRKKTITEQQNTEELIKSFKDHMAKYGIQVSYGKSEDENEIYIEVDKCLFNQEGLKKRFCNYSKNFLEAYFNGESKQLMSIEEGNYCCLFKIKLKA